MSEVRPDVMAFGVCVARGTLTRLDRAFSAFYRRIRRGEKPGYPRFRGAARFDSFEYPDRSGWRLDERTHRLHLLGVGHVKARLHRPLRGDPRTCTVRREGRRWRVMVFCRDVPTEALPPTGRQVGIDLGVAELLSTSGGEHIRNPRHLGRSHDKLAQAQRRLARSKRGSRRRRKACEGVSACHRKVRRQRLDHLHQVSRGLVAANDLIVVEKLRIRDMTRSAKGTAGEPGTNVAQKAGLNRSILDAGWGVLLRLLAYKAEEAGRQLIAVDPRHTSSTCARCGFQSKENRHSQAVFRCQRCGHEAHADTNAARNILRAGLAQRQKREADQ